MTIVDCTKPLEINVQKDRSPVLLPLYGEKSDVLKTSIPEYDISALPNVKMTEFVQDMQYTRQVNNGVGLASPQCGVLCRMFVIGTDQFNIVCINPKILKFSEETTVAKEGCLSFPGLMLNVERPNTVTVEFWDQFGTRIEAEYSGMTARIFQHELDHLDGVCFVDRIGRVSLRLAREKQKKMLKRMKKRK